MRLMDAWKNASAETEKMLNEGCSVNACGAFHTGGKFELLLESNIYCLICSLIHNDLFERWFD